MTAHHAGLVYGRLIDDPRGAALNSTALLTLGAMGWFAARAVEDTMPQCWASTQTLADRSKLSRRAIVAALKRLEAAGAIERNGTHPGPTGPTVCYDLVALSPEWRPTSSSARRAHLEDSEGVHVVPQGVHEVHTNLKEAFRSASGERLTDGLDRSGLAASTVVAQLDVDTDVVQAWLAAMPGLGEDEARAGVDGLRKRHNPRDVPAYARTIKTAAKVRELAGITPAKPASRGSSRKRPSKPPPVEPVEPVEPTYWNQVGRCHGCGQISFHAGFCELLHIRLPRQKDLDDRGRCSRCLGSQFHAGDCDSRHVELPHATQVQSVETVDQRPTVDVDTVQRMWPDIADAAKADHSFAGTLLGLAVRPVSVSGDRLTVEIDAAALGRFDVAREPLRAALRQVLGLDLAVEVAA